MKNKHMKNQTPVENGALNQINAGTHIEGKIITNGNIRIDGSVKGKVESKGKVVLGPTCKIEGDVVAVNAELIGHLSGNIIVSEKLYLKNKCLLEGDIEANILSIEDGAKFNGQCQMGGSRKQNESTFKTSEFSSNGGKFAENKNRAHVDAANKKLA